jgi:Fur family ferric uptake transcriptional regulator
MRNIIKQDRMEGHPVTAQRQLLMKLLSEVGGHIDARELYNRAALQDSSISLATVYRNLRLFRELGMVEERRLGRMRCCYELKSSSEHQHLVCRGCGKVIEFDTPLIQGMVEEIRKKHNFRLVKAELCLEGYCADCKE